APSLMGDLQKNITINGVIGSMRCSGVNLRGLFSLSDDINAVRLAIIPFLAAIFFHEKMNRLKVISIFMPTGSFASLLCRDHQLKRQERSPALIGMEKKEAEMGI
ncbi:hypothetical protein Pfo_026603, partial [Paulownia fortunei]